MAFKVKAFTAAIEVVDDGEAHQLEHRINLGRFQAEMCADREFLSASMALADQIKDLPAEARTEDGGFNSDHEDGREALVASMAQMKPVAEIWRKAIISVKGYEDEDGNNLTDSEGWRHQVPELHAFLAGMAAAGEINRRGERAKNSPKPSKSSGRQGKTTAKGA